MKSKPIKVYASEIEDGLEQVILDNSSIAYLSCAEECEPFDITKLKAVAGEGVADSDILYYMKSILASVALNKNDDVFLKEELWKARNTPEDKPFNNEHEDDVIGHITGNYCIDAEGSVIDDKLDIDEVPEKFHVVTSSVIYKSWKTPERQEKIDELIEEVKAGKRFVSMECLLKNFDYMLIENAGTEKAIASIVKRTKDTAYLTKHLRIYKGSGSYNGKQVKRVLRNFNFSGKGLVKKPANPESVILQSVEANELVYIPVNENKESLMAIENTFEKENMELKAKVEKLTASLIENDQKVLLTKIKASEDEVKTLREENEKLKADLEAESKKLQEVSTAKAGFEVALAKIETATKLTNRTNAVAVALNLEVEKASKIIANLMGLSDTEFDGWIKSTAEYEAEKVAAYNAAMSNGGTPASNDKGDPMANGGKKIAGKPSNGPTPIAVIPTPGAKTSFPGYTVNIPNSGTKAVNLPPGVTASEVLDPAEQNTEISVETAVPVVTPALAASMLNEKVENRRKDISAYFDRNPKESK